MRYTTKAEYGIVALMNLARSEGQGPKSAALVAEEEGISPEYVEKLLQKLRLFGLVESQRGAGGGFRIATDPEKITLRHVIESLEGTTFQAFCADEVREKIVCNSLSACGLEGVWRGLKGVMDDYLGGITLGDLMSEHAQARADAGGSMSPST